MYVGEDEPRDLHQRDDERSFSHGAEMISHQTHHRGQDGSQRQLGLVSENAHHSTAGFYTLIGYVTKLDQRE